jgi:hypothetical protein
VGLLFIFARDEIVLVEKMGIFDDLYDGPGKADSMALWQYYPRQISQAEAHQLSMRYYFEWFIPRFEWLKAQQR